METVKIQLRVKQNFCLFFSVRHISTRVDVLTTFSDDHGNSGLIQRCKKIFQNDSELIIDAHCMNFNENHCFRAKTAIISVITE